MNRTNFDVIIVGNGAVGASIATELLSRNSDITIAVIGKKTRPGAASVAAGAMLNVFAELEAGQLEKSTFKEKFDVLGYPASKAWKTWEEKLITLSGVKSATAFVKYGTYIVQNTAADDLDDVNMKAIVKALKEYNEEFEIVDPRSIKGYYPSQRERALSAIHVPNEGFIPSKKLFELYDAIFQNNKQVTLIDEEAVGLDLNLSNPVVNLSSGAKVTGKDIVLANGSHAQKLIDQVEGLASKIPRLFYGNGNSVVIKVNKDVEISDKVIRTSNRGMACGIHSVPYDDNTIFIGASNSIKPFPTYEPMVSTIPTILDSFMSQINQKIFNSYISEFRVGHRPTTIDTYPILGPTSVKGLWIASGTKRDGLFCSPVIAKQFADAILSKQNNFSKTFLPERKPLFNLSREEGINLTVQHMMSAGYQHQLKLPVNGWEDLVKDTLTQKIVSTYDKAGLKNFGLPPEMYGMLESGECSEYLS